MVDHPWDDGTVSDDELKEMVDFCDSYFNATCKTTPCSCCVPTELVHEWEWKKGDWFYSDGAVLLLSVLLPSGTPPKEAIPLPLAHQWLRLNVNLKLLWEGEIWVCEVWDWEGDEAKLLPCHMNPHFACYKAFRKVIEDG